QIAGDRLESSADLVGAVDEESAAARVSCELLQARLIALRVHVESDAVDTNSAHIQLARELQRRDSAIAITFSGNNDQHSILVASDAVEMPGGKGHRVVDRSSGLGCDGIHGTLECLVVGRQVLLEREPPAERHD